jgi:hypothetical protein
VIIDPNETWREFFRSMANFSDPKVVPVSSLPRDYDPSKRKYQSLKTLFNWRNQNIVESYKPTLDRSAVSIDMEKNELVDPSNPRA